MYAPPPRVVIVGAGFGGLEAARMLGRAQIPTLLVDRHNYHLFQPLLYQVATAALSPADIAAPIRSVLSRYRSVEVLLGKAAGVDVKRQAVLLADGRLLPYSRLILATGSTYGYFGHPEWGAFTRGLKSIDDARAIRSRLLLAFERAEMEQDPEKQKALMTIVIIGGGPTGVELAGSIAELARRALRRNFRRIRPENASVVLLEAGPRILSGFPKELSAYAMRRLRALGVEVRLDTPVQEVGEESVDLGDQTLHSGCIIWAAGVLPSAAGRWLQADTDDAGRVKVGPDLAVSGVEDVYVIGDLALALDSGGAPLPGLAQVAKQQGAHLGRFLANQLRTGAPVPPFRFRDRGNAAIIGRHAAVFDFGRMRLTGVPAWSLWAAVHVILLVGFGNRLSVTVQWLWRYLTFQRGARLIAEAPSGSAPAGGAKLPSADGS